jgi:hypothetical protein
MTTPTKLSKEELESHLNAVCDLCEYTGPIIRQHILAIEAEKQELGKEHNPLCAVFETDPTGIKKPCNCSLHHNRLIREERDTLKKENTAFRRRISGEISEDCPFCAIVTVTGHSQNSPMCRLCELESSRDQLHETNAVLQSQIDNADTTWKQQKLITDQLRAQVDQWQNTASKEAHRVGDLTTENDQLKAQVAEMMEALDKIGFFCAGQKDLEGITDLCLKVLANKPMPCLSPQRPRFMTPNESIQELRKMQSQIIHGSNIFGDIADVIENISSQNKALERASAAFERQCDQLRAQVAEITKQLKTESDCALVFQKQTVNHLSPQSVIDEIEPVLEALRKDGHAGTSEHCLCCNIRVRLTALKEQLEKGASCPP